MLKTYSPWKDRSIKLPSIKYLSTKPITSILQFPRLRRLHASTLMYSSILAVAVAADVQLKVKRREEIEAKIQHERSELEKLETASQARTQRLLAAKHKREDAQLFPAARYQREDAESSSAPIQHEGFALEKLEAASQARTNRFFAAKHKMEDAQLFPAARYQREDAESSSAPIQQTFHHHEETQAGKLHGKSELKNVEESFRVAKAQLPAANLPNEDGNAQLFTPPAKQNETNNIVPITYTYPKSKSEEFLGQQDYLEKLLHYRPKWMSFRNHRQAPPIPCSYPLGYVRFSTYSPWQRRFRYETIIPVMAPHMLMRLSLCVAKLVIRMCLIFDFSNSKYLWPSPRLDTYIHQTEEELLESWKNVEYSLADVQWFKTRPMNLKAIGFRLPRYSNQSLDLQLCFHRKFGRLCPPGLNIEITNDMAYLICKYLIESRSYPDIFTINYLLNAFNRANRHDLIDIIEQFFTDTTLLANEITCCEILRSYRERNSASKFMKFMNRMRGIKGPWHLASRHRSLMPDHPHYDVYYCRRRAETGQVFQSVVPHPIIYAEILRGLLRFTGLHETLKVCEELWAENWGFSYTCIHLLIRQCVIDKEWEIGITIWKYTEDLIQKGFPIPSKLAACMLALCSETDQNTHFSTLMSKSLTELQISTDDMLKLIESEINAVKKQP